MSWWILIRSDPANVLEQVSIVNLHKYYRSFISPHTAWSPISSSNFCPCQDPQSCHTRERRMIDDWRWIRSRDSKSRPNSRSFLVCCWCLWNTLPMAAQSIWRRTSRQGSSSRMFWDQFSDTLELLPSRKWGHPWVEWVHGVSGTPRNGRLIPHPLWSFVGADLYRQSVGSSRCADLMIEFPETVAKCNSYPQIRHENDKPLKIKMNRKTNFPSGVSSNYRPRCHHP